MNILNYLYKKNFCRLYNGNNNNYGSNFWDADNNWNIKNGMGYYCWSKKKINIIYIMMFTHAPVTIEYIIMCFLISLEIIADISMIIICIKELTELNNIRDF